MASRRSEIRAIANENAKARGQNKKSAQSLQELYTAIELIRGMLATNKEDIPDGLLPLFQTLAKIDISALKGVFRLAMEERLQIGAGKAIKKIKKVNK